MGFAGEAKFPCQVSGCPPGGEGLSTPLQAAAPHASPPTSPNPASTPSPPRPKSRDLSLWDTASGNHPCVMSLESSGMSELSLLKISSLAWNCIPQPLHQTQPLPSLPGVEICLSPSLWDTARENHPCVMSLESSGLLGLSLFKLGKLKISALPWNSIPHPLHKTPLYSPSSIDLPLSLLSFGTLPVGNICVMSLGELWPVSRLLKRDLPLHLNCIPLAGVVRDCRGS